MNEPEFTLGDSPIEERFRDRMNAICIALDEIFNGTDPDRETGFILLVYPFGEGEHRCNFITNGADRHDIVALFRELITRFEGQPNFAALSQHQH